MATEKSNYVWDINLPTERGLYTKTFPKRKRATFMWDIVFDPFNDSGKFKLRSKKAPVGKIITQYSVILKCHVAGRIDPFVKAVTDDFEFFSDADLPKSGVIHEHYIFDDYKKLVSEKVDIAALHFTIDISAYCIGQALEELCSTSVNSDCQKSAKSHHTKQLLHSVFTDPEFYDVTIQVDGTKIKAHRSILAAASPVFRASLTNNMLEKNSGCIDVKDLTADVVQLMVDFIYNGDVKLTSYQVAVNLLKASDIYDVKDLKNLCTGYIVHQISKDNVLEILLAADMNNAENLKNIANDYIIKNLIECKPSDFDDIMKYRPHLLPLLLVNTFKTYAKYKKK